MRWLVVLLLGVASLAQTSEARACSCMKLNPSEGLSSSHAVFTGEVIEIERNEATKFGGLEVTLRVKDVWKGAPQAEVKVRTAGSSAACGYSFVKGETYLVYAVNDEADPMRVSLCSRTALVANAKEDLNFLGKPSHRFDTDASARKSKKSEAGNDDNCSASGAGTEHTGLAWMLVLLAGATVMIRRLV